MNNWLTSTIEIVREKSLGALEFVRKDLSEFTSTVKSDAENYLQKINPQSSDRSKPLENKKDPIPPVTVDRFQNERIRMQNDESTYLTDPTPIESYTTWCETNDFTDDKHKAEIAKVLIDIPSIRSFYARFVPACTTHNKFWSRYYYRIHKLDEDETRRINLLKRAQELCNENSENDWDEPNDQSVSENLITEVKETHLSTSKPATSNNELDDEWETWS